MMEELKLKFLFVCALIFLVSAGQVLGDWDPDDGYKMHYPQLPDLNPTGMDVLAGPFSVDPEGTVFYEKFLADDFLCTESGPITGIHIWCSYRGDIKYMDTPLFSLVIYDNVPAGAGGLTYSTPGQALWDTYVQPTVELVYATDVEESFYDPNPDEIVGNDTEVWQYNFEFDAADAFYQERDNIYWLGVHHTSDLDDSGAVDPGDWLVLIENWPGSFGWKTSGVDQYEDDAVWTEVFTWLDQDPHVVPVGPWLPLDYPAGHLYEDMSIDLAFVITGPEPVELDFGDAPRPYPTLLAVDGARHIIGGPYFCDAAGGGSPDPEGDGQPHLDALGDDTDGNDDEDGVQIPLLTAGIPAFIGLDVCGSAPGGGAMVEIWIDWHSDGSWDASDMAFAGPLMDGPALVPVLPPANSVNGPTFARCRISTAGGLSPTGQASDGEVEDHKVYIEGGVKRPVPHLKWSQPPIPMDPNDEIPVYCGWDEKSYRDWVETSEPGWFDCWDCRTQCHGDADCDGDVDADDEAILMAALGGIYPNPPYDECADFDHDLQVWNIDLAIFMANEGTNPDPNCPLRPESSQMVADDFRCLGTMPIESIHWWGSYVGWDNPEEMPLDVPIGWRFGFWSNVPADPDLDPNYSYPNELLWQIEVDADRVTVDQVGWDYYYDWYPSDICYQYYVDLEPNEVFWQNKYLDRTEDEIFWLSITAIYDPSLTLIDYPWGWKTRPWSWMDDAVKFWLDGAPEPGLVLDPEEDVVIEPIEDPEFHESFDVAFELDTDPNYIKWEQPFTDIRLWPHFWDEFSMGWEEHWIDYKWWQEPNPIGWDVAFRDFDGRLVELADDWQCDETGPIDDIHFWTSYEDDWWGPINQITVRIYTDDPCDPAIPGDYSEPNELKWERTFLPGEFIETWYDSGDQGWFDPVTGIWIWPDHVEYYIVDINVPDNPFIQEQGNIYWLSIEANSVDSNVGWKTSSQQWNDKAVYKDPSTGQWRELYDPETGAWLDLAFALTTKESELDIGRLVADDWPCDYNTPITAAVWWGSYIDYGYEACQDPYMSWMPLPVKPDYFWLTIWDDVPAGADLLYSHPNDIIWEYKAYDYDEVLVGYDKFPHGDDDPNEPVFRYSVRLPFDKWFAQEEPNDIYWFSVVAVYDQHIPNYSWGWTNHKHVYNDDAVEGYLDIGGPAPVWSWYELYDQTQKSEDMSFILFTEPGCYPYTDPDYKNWLDVGKPGSWCCKYQAQGDTNGDGAISALDLFLCFKPAYNTQHGVDPAYDPDADFNHDKAVSALDLFLIFKPNYNTNPGPGYDCPYD